MTKDEVVADAREMLKEAELLKAEAGAVHAELKSLWDTDKDPDRRHFPFTSTGLTMCAFGVIDRWATFWFPNERDRTKRMVTLLGQYLYPSHPKAALEIAVQLWRHKAVHNAKLEVITERATGKKYRWWFHYEGSDEHQFKLRDPDADGVACIGLALRCFLQDLCAGLQRAVRDLEAAPATDSRIQKWEDTRKETYSYTAKF